MILTAETELVEMSNTAASDVPMAIKIKVKNTGDAVWLSCVRKWGGYVTLGIKLQDANGVEQSMEGDRFQKMLRQVRRY
jgi:hypothetical protein